MAVKKKKDSTRKNRILGLLLFLCGLLIAVSLFTHDQINDSALLLDGNLGKLLSSPVVNKGGFIGVLVAYALLAVFGYLALLLFLGIWSLSYGFFFSKDIKVILRNIGFVSLFLYFIGLLFSLGSARQSFISTEPGLGGLVGHYSALVLIVLTGTVISYTIVISLILGCLIWIMPSDINKHSKVFIRLIIGFREKVTNLLSMFKPKKRIKISEKAQETQKSSLIGRIIRIKKPLKKSKAKVEIKIPAESTDDIVPEDTTKSRIQKPEKAVSTDNGYSFPSIDLLSNPPYDEPAVSEQELHQTAEALKETLGTFGVELANREVQIYPGPIITRFEFKPAPGVKVSQVINLADDLALAMKAKRIRIVAPIPGKSAIGIEIPNRIGQIVYLKDIITGEDFKDTELRLPLALGKTISGKTFVVDLAGMPHLLIAGATGSGKSVCINCVITSLLYRLSPERLRFILIDPKMLELSVYNDLPHLEKPVVTEMKYAEKVLAEAVIEMEDRYRHLTKKGVRNIRDYNEIASEPLPYVVIIVDELADLMMIGSNRIETLITRLAQMARAVGIHLILATQRPSVDVITGLIKANFSTRIAFQVATKVDSRTILDVNGAEKLLGNGDMLFMNPAYPEPKRVHGAFVSGAETRAICQAVGSQEYRPEPIDNFKANSNKISQYDPIADAVFKEAVGVVIKHKQGSVSLLQRRLGIGYQRAARLIDQLEEAGIVGPYDGSKAREVLVDEQYLVDNYKDYSNNVSQ